MNHACKHHNEDFRAVILWSILHAKIRTSGGLAESNSLRVLPLSRSGIKVKYLTACRAVNLVCTHTNMTLVTPHKATARRGTGLKNLLSNWGTLSGPSWSDATDGLPQKGIVSYSGPSFPSWGEREKKKVKLIGGSDDCGRPGNSRSPIMHRVNNGVTQSGISACLLPSWKFAGEFPQ